MKKVVLAGVLGCFGMVSADSDVSGKEAFAGFNVGAGLNYVHSKADVDCTFVDPTGSSPSVSGGSKCSKGRFGGYFALGYGNFVSASNWYVGGTIVVDVDKKNRHEYSIADVSSNVSSKNSGVVPSMCFKLGRYVDSVDSLLFIEFGLCRNSCNVAQSSSAIVAVNSLELSNRRFTPVVGLGMEKMICDNLSFYASWNYRVPSFKSSVIANYAAPAYCVASANNKSHVVRVGCVYHF